MELHKDRFSTIAHIPGHAAIELIWTTETAAMNNQDFKDALELFVGYAAEHSAPNLLVDLRPFRHNMTPELGKWRDEVIAPKYNAAGVKKFAYLIGSVDSANRPSQNAGEDFVTGYFESTESGRSWFSED